jgi:predicted dinucleotide-binding enzyme
VIFLFAEKFGETISVSATQIKDNFAEKIIITLVFEKNANFFAENRQKSQKIVIITSVPGQASQSSFPHLITRPPNPVPYIIHITPALFLRTSGTLLTCS